MRTSDRQLLLYRFDSGAHFEGQLLGALERLEAGGSLRVVETLFIGNDPQTGELEAIQLRRVGAGGIVAPLLSFRLDTEERRRATERALAGDTADLIRSVAGSLAPGEAVAAVLVAHEWAKTLDDAVARMGGASLPGGFVEAATLAELAPELVSGRSP